MACTFFSRKNSSRSSSSSSPCSRNMRPHQGWQSTFHNIHRQYRHSPRCTQGQHKQTWVKHSIEGWRQLISEHPTRSVSFPHVYASAAWGARFKVAGSSNTSRVQVHRAATPELRPFSSTPFAAEKTDRSGLIITEGSGMHALPSWLACLIIKTDTIASALRSFRTHAKTEFTPSDCSTQRGTRGATKYNIQKPKGPRLDVGDGVFEPGPHDVVESVDAAIGGLDGLIQRQERRLQRGQVHQQLHRLQECLHSQPGPIQSHV